MKTNFPLVCGGVLVLFAAMSCGTQKPKHGEVDQKMFDTLLDSKQVKLVNLVNKNGVEVQITNYGARVVSVWVPDKNGKFDDVVLGFSSIKDYLKVNPNFGAVVGRYGNRIGNAQFNLNGTVYKLEKNDGKNTLHGGFIGYDERVWNIEKTDKQSLELSYLSKDQEEGFPGNLKITVTYTLTDSNELKINYAATTDKPTVLNLTNHSYFNLNGQDSGDILGEEIMINADKFTPVDDGLIPTGELRAVAGTPLDFTKSTLIGSRINDSYEQIKFGKGYDHNFVLNKKGKELSVAAVAYDPKSGRVLEVTTTEPGVQFYTGNFLDGKLIGKSGKGYIHRGGFCLETQHFPDSPNHPEFPTTTLNPGENYNTTTIFKFSVKK